MPTTSNFGWTTPADTDLVKDGAAAIRTLGNGIDTSFLDLKGGTTGQVLSKASNTDLDFSWVAADDADAIQKSLIDAEGDLIVGDAADAVQRLAIGSNGNVLTVDTSVDGKIKWAAPASGSTYVGAGVSKTTNQNITNVTWTACTFHSEDWDTNGFHDNSTNTSRLTVPSGKAGKYQITAQLYFADNAIYGAILAIYKNGSSIYGAGQDYIGKVSASQEFFFGSMTVDAAVGDYYELYVFHNSSGNGVIDTARLQFDYLGA